MSVYTSPGKWWKMQVMVTPVCFRAASTAATRTGSAHSSLGAII